VGAVHGEGHHRVGKDEAQYGDKRTEDHAVFVHVTESGDPERARRLAAHIGGEAPGEERLGR
jgi:hypothetical protein